MSHPGLSGCQASRPLHPAWNLTNCARGVRTNILRHMVLTFWKVRPLHRLNASTPQNSSRIQNHNLRNTTLAQLGGVNVPKLKRQTSLQFEEHDLCTIWMCLCPKTQATGEFAIGDVRQLHKLEGSTLQKPEREASWPPKVRATASRGRASPHRGDKQVELTRQVELGGGACSRRMKGVKDCSAFATAAE